MYNSREKQLVCIKIGGGVITDKATPFTKNEAAIIQFSTAIADIRMNLDQSVDLMLANGAGSFGHFTAHEFGLLSGAKTEKQWHGTTITHNYERELNTTLGHALTEKGVPAFCMSPGDFCTSRNGLIADGSIQLIENLLARGVVPLLHGDTIYDTVTGVDLVSTERVLLWFGKALRDQYDSITFIAVTQTGGVMDSNGAIISELAHTDTVPPLSGYDHDVTGGMQSKVALLREAIGWLDAAYITANNAQLIERAILHRASGTKII